jgi:hypothetical protein
MGAKGFEGLVGGRGFEDLTTRAPELVEDLDELGAHRQRFVDDKDDPLADLGHLLGTPTDGRDHGPHGFCALLA